MTHPEDLLAEYVDGTLPDEERAVVDAHLATCSRCRQEIQAAGHAVAALAALGEEPVPLGVTGPVLAEAERAAQRAVPRRRPTRDRFQWAGGLAAAAALLLVAAVLVPRLFGGSRDEAAGGAARAPTAEAGAGDAALGATAAPLRLEVFDRDLDDDDLQRLAKEAADTAPAFPEREASATLESPDPAIACFDESGMTVVGRDVLVRVIRARYLGTPAYVGMFHESPTPGEPPDTIVVLVVSSADCSILTIASQRI